MPPEIPLSQSIEAALLNYEPEKYWAVWQFPEQRYAYMIGFEREAWLITMDSEEAGASYLSADAFMNGRPLSAYRLDELSLPDAFAAARAQAVPFLSSQGTPVLSVLGIELRTGGGGGTRLLRRIPL